MADEDRAFREGAALLDLGGRETVLEVRGRDAEDYLQRRLSCDLRRATATPGGGAAIPGTLMNAKGKLIAPFVLWRVPAAKVAPGAPAGERFRLAVERTALDPLREGLERLVILEEVQIALAELAILSVQGPTADRVLHGESAGGEPLPAAPLAFAALEVGAAEPGLVMRRSRSPAGGFDLLVPAGVREGLHARLEREGARTVGEEAIERHRIAAGIPRFGIDATSENLPTECGYDDAIAYDKGCYAGQEVVARIRTYGHVNRRLCRLLLAGDVLAPIGAELRAEEEPEKAIGAITSAAREPGGKGVIALARVNRRHARAGQGLRYGNIGNGRVTAVVTKGLGNEPNPGI